MDTKSKKSDKRIPDKLLSVLFAAVFAFLFAWEGLVALRANVTYYNKTGYYNTPAFIASLRNDIVGISNIRQNVNGESVKYSSFEDYETLSPTAKTLREEYESKKEKALTLFADIQKIKKLCPENNSDYAEDEYTEKTSDEVEYTDVNGNIYRGEDAVLSQKITVKDYYASYDEWRNDYAALRTQIFNIVYDATSEDSIINELDEKCNDALWMNYSNSISSYNSNTVNYKTNLQYLIIEKESDCQFGNLSAETSEDEFISSLSNDTGFYIRYENGRLKSPSVRIPTENSFLQLLANLEIISPSIDETYLSNVFDNADVYIKIAETPTPNDSYYSLFKNYESVLGKNGEAAIILTVEFLLLSLCFTVVAAVLFAKKGEFETHLHFWDKFPFFIYFTIYACVITLFGFCAAAVVYFDTVTSDLNLTTFRFMLSPKLVCFGIAALVTAMSLSTLLFILYIARNGRAGAFKRRFFLGLFSIGIHSFFTRNTGINASLKRIKATGILLLLGFFFGNALFAFLAFIADEAGAFFFILLLVLNGVGLVFLLRFTRDVMRLADFTEEIKKGDFEKHIDPNAFVKPLQKTAKDLEECRNSIKIAVDEAMKGERLKTELITNVSHDLKTPLTSIINYVNLLKLDNIPPEDKANYLDILEKKSKKLHRLIDDLTEASKAASGNLKVEVEKVNLNELALQAVGENSDALENAGLDLQFNEPNNSLFVNCNTQHTFRVLDNLFSNAKKYSLTGSRVYADVYRENGYGVFSLKNVSRDQLNVAPNELTERFVRGDKSRTTEGSGLGLSIARSFTEMQGGIFELEIDGDLFKANVKLPLAEGVPQADFGNAPNLFGNTPPNMRTSPNQPQIK